MLHADGVLLLPRLQVQSANAISGPLTWGFPAITAFTGFAHALQRQLDGRFDIRLQDVAVISHHFEPQVSQPAGKRTRVFNLSRNPLATPADRKKIAPDSSFTSPSFSEEGRAHLELSLLISVQGSGVLYPHEQDELLQAVTEQLQRMRIAGGSLLPLRDGARYRPSYIELAENSQDQFQQLRQLRRRLLPGFALVSAAYQLQERLETDEAAPLEQWLDLSRLNIVPPAAEGGDTADVEWHYRRAAGWTVPIPVGYAAISPLCTPGTVANARDCETPFHFVETLYSLGQWISPHRVERLEQLFWHPETRHAEGLYLCTNAYKPMDAV